MDMFTVPSLAWGGSEKSSVFPHRCPYRQAGISKKDCEETSGESLQKNLAACCGTQRGVVVFGPCNSAARRCRVCLEEGKRGLKAGAVVDVAKGTCLLHSGAEERTEFRLSAEPRRSRIPQFGTTVPSDVTIIRGAKVREHLQDAAHPHIEEPVMLTKSQYSKVDDLDAEETVVLKMMSYGFDERAIEKELKKERRTSDRSFADIVSSIYAKLGVHTLEKESERRRRAGKMYIDYCEMNRMNEEPLSDEESDEEDDGVPDMVDELIVAGSSDTEESDEDVDITLAARSEPRGPDASFDAQGSEGDIEMTTGSATDDAIDSAALARHEGSNERESGMATDTLATERAVAARFAEAREAGRGFPVRATFAAAQSMRLKQLALREIGEAFGYKSTSAAAWACNILKLDGISADAWKLIGDQYVPISFLLDKVVPQDGRQHARIVRDYLEAKPDAAASERAKEYRSGPSEDSPRAWRARWCERERCAARSRNRGSGRSASRCRGQR